MPLSKEQAKMMLALSDHDDQISEGFLELVINCDILPPAIKEGLMNNDTKARDEAFELFETTLQRGELPRYVECEDIMELCQQGNYQEVNDRYFGEPVLIGMGERGHLLRDDATEEDQGLLSRSPFDPEKTKFTFDVKMVRECSVGVQHTGGGVIMGGKGDTQVN